MKRLVISLTLGPVLVLVSVLWFVLGLLSMRALGRALEQTGKNLQRYDW